MPRTSLQDPLKAFDFIVEIGGFQRAGFMEVSGIEMSTEVVNYREGGNSLGTTKSPGQTDFPPITLRRGVIVGLGEDDIVDWYKLVYDATSNGKQAINFRKDIDIVVLRRDRLPGARFRFVNVWPSSLKHGDLNTGANEVFTEEMILQHEGWTKVAV